MRIIIEARGRTIIDLRLLAPAGERAAEAPPAGAEPAAVTGPASVTASQIEMGDDGVRGFGFGLVVRAGEPPAPPS